jgi:hypothetical protein
MNDTQKAKELILLAKQLLNTSDNQGAYKAQNELNRAIESLANTDKVSRLRCA